ncbi:YutD family protein [Furfurilactobacillus curtus]|uniref:DUF1027 domain-containing protein n=1 Tax=Furfurilactobacillus curtus TaxID=1746200 RepID=A0ABQ5JMV6_9LACO
MFNVVRENDAQFFINGHPYELVYDFHQAFDVHQFADRYSTVLSKYDFIVGDIGFEQLRLKGFYAADAPQVPVSQTITALNDYLYEYCNFGCAYFVLHNLDVEIDQQDQPQKVDRHRSRHASRQRRREASSNQQVETNNGNHRSTHSQSGNQAVSHHSKNNRPQSTLGNDRTTAADKRSSVRSGSEQPQRTAHRKTRRHFTIRQKGTSESGTSS